jgi:LysR family transcriptional regulator (chromosome initiation inhibitor)
MLILRNPLLSAFEAISRLGTAHAAAKELNVTQTAITQRIKALESGLEMNLFLRSRRGMTLTDDGKALLQYCYGTRELEGQFLSLTQGQARSDVSVKIIGPTSAIATRIARDVEPIYSKYSFLRIHLQSSDNDDKVEMIRRGDADIAIVSPKEVPNEMTSKMLRPDRYVLVASKHWSNRKLSDILGSERAIDFNKSDTSTSNYLGHFGLKSTRERLFINENDALIRMFISGIGYGTLTEMVAAPFIANGKLIKLNKGQTVEDPLALVWFPRSRKIEYFEHIIRSIK